MTKKELIDAYIRGDIDRRGFIRKLTAAGVSASAAIAYAGTFVSGVAASSARNEAGFLMNAQGVVNDDEYGTAFTFASDEEAIGLVLDSISAVLAIVQEIGDFTEADFDPGVFAVVTDILSQQQEHADALSSILGDTPYELPPAGTPSTAEEFLTDLAAALDDLCALYAAVAPALESGEARQTVTNILAVASRHAAIISELAGLDPVPETFQQPALP